MCSSDLSGAGVFGFGISQVEGFGDWEVGTGNDTGEVCILCISADDSRVDAGDIVVDQAGAEDTDGSGESDGCCGDLQNGGFISQFDGSRFGGSPNLAFICGMVTAQQNGAG